jgi:hypothetical protein
MRRMDRAVYLILGTALAPLVAWARPDLARAPIVAALALVAVVGNVSAAGRFAALGRKARDRATATPSLSRGRVSTPAAPPPPRAPRPHDVAAAAKLE